MKFTSEDLLNAMGLKVGQRVLIPVYNNTELIITKDGLKNEFYSDLSIAVLVDEDFTIIQPKPTLTEDEKVILRNVLLKYKWISRDKNDKNVNCFITKPIRCNNGASEGKTIWCDIESHSTDCIELPFPNLFQFIKWEDEPYSIEELLEE